MTSLILIFLLALGHDSALGLRREYIYNGTALSWLEAQSYCRKIYHDLATISTTEENYRFFTLDPGDGGWIGLKRIEDIWTWSCGEQFSFQKWYGGSPYKENAGYDCASLSAIVLGYWVNRDCNDERPFYCYRFLVLVKESKTWDEARQYCRTHYTGLASVTSEASLQEVKQEAAETQTESVWTGLRFTNGIWFWVSKEQLGSLVSMPSCPAPSHHCGALNTATNTLTNQHCNQKLNFICY